MSQNEKIMYIIQNVSIKEGLLRSPSYRVIVTNERLVFAKVTKEMVKEENQALKENLKGKGFKERVGVLMTSSQQAQERYQSMAVEEILRETEGNFAVPFTDIRKVKRPMGTRFDENNQPYPRNITIHTQQGKHVLKFHYANESDDAYRVLKDCEK